MSDPGTQSEPLLRRQAAINMPAQGGRSSRSYKVVGITLLACVLIAGQAMIAYFLLSQRSDIKSLEEESDNLKSELTKGRSAAAKPIQMHMPMNSFPDLMDDEEATTSAQDKSAPPPITECQLEAAGMKPVQLPGFRPACDERGFYQAQQCYMRKCWCVNPANGREIPLSLRNGPASCSAAVATGRMSAVLTLPDAVV